MSAVTKQRKPARGRLDSERRMVIRNVDWTDYVCLVDSLVEGSPFRVAYDGKDMEIMTKGKDHERFCDLLNHYIISIAQVQGRMLSPTGKPHGVSFGPSAVWRRTTGTSSIQGRGSKLPGPAVVPRSFQAPTWRSRSTFPHPRSTGPEFMPHLA